MLAVLATTAASPDTLILQYAAYIHTSAQQHRLTAAGGDEGSGQKPHSDIYKKREMYNVQQVASDVSNKTMVMQISSFAFIYFYNVMNTNS